MTEMRVQQDSVEEQSVALIMLLPPALPNAAPSCWQFEFHGMFLGEGALR
jgi:hypothetical protein